MDTLFRLRVLVWILVLALWAHITYQFISEEEGVPPVEMHSLVNPFPQESLPRPSLLSQTPDSQDRSSLTPYQPTPSLATAPPSGSFIKPLPTITPPLSDQVPVRPLPTDESLRRHEFGPFEEQQSPTGFFKSTTDHFTVFSEAQPAKQNFLDTLENLHANLMLDLAAFSPWANNERITIYLFRSQTTYHRVTGRPAWSGGASSISKRTIYLYQSDETIGILAHEMCHIYFDGYFLEGEPDPLWLSEGIATLIQVERGLSTPNWLPENLETLRRGGGFRLYDLMRVTSTAGANDDNVRLWYTQSYSVVRFLLRFQGHASFFHLCHYLRDGQPLHEAMLNAYGMPYNRVQALEFAWRYNLRTHQLSSLPAAQ